MPIPLDDDGEAAFKDLPRFDARDFEPPAWANGPQFQWGKNGESSKSSYGGRRPDLFEENGDAQLEEEEDESWEDASEGRSVIDPELATFTTAELRTLLGKAVERKNTGNTYFTLKPPDLERAVASYKAALDYLPPCPRETVVPEPPLTDNATSGLAEVNDEEAAAIEEQQHAAESDSDPESREREEVEEEVRECTKACWGNLGACYTSLHDDKEAADACTKALEIDPHYVKALQRRAAANDRLSTWSSLTTAQEDYTLLLTLLPASSPQLVQTGRAISTLPARLKIQQEKEKDEMLDKLKDLGNGILGKFGLSTDMFKFDQQAGGGYNMRFER